MATELIIVLPAFNEADGIARFLREIDEAFVGIDLSLIVVDDFSTDGTLQRVSDTRVSCEVLIQRNERNMGHGPSVLRGVQAALKLSSNLIMTADGDGQVSGSQLRRLYDQSVATCPDITEGWRTLRQDPLYRVIVSWCTRVVLRALGAKGVRDANTPVRIYRRSVAAELFDQISDKAMVPNLIVSLISRRRSLKIIGLELETRNRLGTSPIGTTWRPKFRTLPSKRFLAFCARSTREVFSYGRKL